MKVKSKKPFRENLAKKVLLQICEQVQQGAFFGSMTMTLHPMNLIVLEDFDIRIKDLFQVDDSEKVKQISYYRAPELTPLCIETEKSQVYSLACVLFEMLTNKCAWDYTNNVLKENPFLEAQFPPNPKDPVTRDFLSKMLNKDPAKRPSLDQILANIREPDL
jgi:serine/threonine protein kinase